MSAALRLAFPGSDVDASAFVARHAGGETPSSAKVLLPSAQYEALADRLMAESGLVLDSTEYLRVGVMLLPLADLTALEIRDAQRSLS